MPKTSRVVKPAPRELVLQKYPRAFVYDDGERVYIRDRIMIKGFCPHCKRPWEREEEDFMHSLGFGGYAEAAWKNAAENLGLL